MLLLMLPFGSFVDRLLSTKVTAVCGMDALGHAIESLPRKRKPHDGTFTTEAIRLLGRYILPAFETATTWKPERRWSWEVIMRIGCNANLEPSAHCLPC